MFLHQLIQSFDPSISLQGIANVEILGICDDSRFASAGDLFIARAGTHTDGSRFAADAVARGAVAVVSGSAIENCPVPLALVSNPGNAGYRLANLFYQHPSRQVRVLGITGTNGKTTTAYLVRHLLAGVNQRCGMIGTVEIDDGRSIREATVTTPGAIEIAKLLAAMRDNGCKACAMETSSHALDQDRVVGVQFAGGAFTNLTEDHFDYHDNMENYANAKAKLFQQLPEDAVAVVNGDDSWHAHMIAGCKARVIRFGFGNTADYRARDVAVTSQGSNFILHTPDGSTQVRMNLIGRHNIQNALTAAALVGEIFGLSVHQIAAGLRDANGAPGRLQVVRAGQPFVVLVDYAHTDDALKNVLTALRPLTRGKLRLLFGCGGDRDRLKRPHMARTAATLADVVHVTSDNPRTEDPGEIIEQIVSGLPSTGSASVSVEPDRRAAIENILRDAQPGDVVLLAGKGHENYQIIGEQKHHFDDVEEATRVLNARASMRQAT